MLFNKCAYGARLKIKLFQIAMVVLLLLVFHVGMAQTVAALDAKNGFRTYKFGMSASRIPNLIKLKQDPYENRYIVKYKKRDENLLVGPYRLTGIVYEFYKDKLMCITLATDFTSANGMLELLQKLYGKPTYVMEATGKNGNDTGTRDWSGKKVHLRVLDYPAGNLAWISYGGDAVYDEMFRDTKNEEALIKRKSDAKKLEALKDL
jgi:hypothetical protein